MRRSRKKIKRSNSQRDYLKYSNHRLMTTIYDRNQKNIINRLGKQKKTNLLDPLRKVQNMRALLFSPPKARLKRALREPIGKFKPLNLNPLKTIICTSRAIRKYVMFAKGNIGHGTSKRRRKMTWTSKVRC